MTPERSTEKNKSICSSCWEQKTETRGGEKSKGGGWLVRENIQGGRLDELSSSVDAQSNWSFQNVSFPA